MHMKMKFDEEVNAILKSSMIIGEGYMDSIEKLVAAKIIPNPNINNFTDNMKLVLGILFDAPSFVHNYVDKEFEDPSKLTADMLNEWTQRVVRDLEGIKYKLQQSKNPKVAIQDVPKNTAAINHHLNVMIVNNNYDTAKVIDRLDTEIKMIHNTKF